EGHASVGHYCGSVLLAPDLAEDCQCPLEVLLGLRVAALVIVAMAQVVGGGGRLGVVLTTHFAINRQGLPVALLRLTVAALSPLTLGQVVIGGGRVAMILAKHFLPDR